MSDPTPPEATQVKPFARVLLKETPSCWPVLTVGEADIVFDETRQLFSAQTTVDLINTAVAAYVAQALADATADREGEVKRLREALAALSRRIDDHFGGAGDYDWKEQIDARAALSPKASTP